MKFAIQYAFARAVIKPVNFDFWLCSPAVVARCVGILKRYLLRSVSLYSKFSLCDGCVSDVIIQFLILTMVLYRVQYSLNYLYLICQVSSRTISCLYFIMLGIFNLVFYT